MRQPAKEKPMGLVKRVEICPLDSMKGGMAEFFTPQSCHETMLVHVPGGTIDDLFVHRYQTDQLLVVRGSMVLIILQNRHYQYIPLSHQHPMVVRIPPGVAHGAINPNPDTCVIVNAVLRHGKPHDRDYVPLKSPFPYDYDRARQALATLEPIKTA
ncbi:MAG: dTDP-4-dehydrorhamnose 3,5-epimerase [Synechococcales bacterium]|nr:dTDP-4-dehydrorhamnose 3,5-epimerase [Synechococcales bacterium]